MQNIRSQTVLFFAILLVATVAVFFIMKPFVYAIFWAVILAGIFMPVYKKVEKKLRRPTESATIVLALICIILILPFGFIVSLLFKESMDIYQSISNDSSQINAYVQKLTQLIKHNRYMDGLHLDDASLTARITELSKSVAGYFFENLKSFDGVVVYQCPTLNQDEEELLIGSAQFQMAAKVQNNDKITVTINQEVYPRTFVRDDSLKGVIALMPCAKADCSYPYHVVKIVKAEQ